MQREALPLVLSLLMRVWGEDEGTMTMKIRRAYERSATVVVVCKKWKRDD